MRIIQPRAEILAYTPDLTKVIEQAIRVCYKSEDRIEEGSDIKIIQNILTNNHESCLEHGSISVRFICDRGVTHELVRHRLAAYSQESTRYCNYGKGKFGSEITVIEPFFFVDIVHHPDMDGRPSMYDLWELSCKVSEEVYLDMLNAGAKPQEARSILPNSLKTEIVMTANPREWRHVFKMRTSSAAHPQIRQIMCPLLVEFRKKWPILFSDVGDITHSHPAEVIDVSNNGSFNSFQSAEEHSEQTNSLHETLTGQVKV